MLINEDNIRYCTVSTDTVPNDSNLEKLIKHMKGIKILHMNIRSIRRNIDELIIFIQGLNTEIDILVLTEAHVHNHLPIFNIPTYECLMVGGQLTRNEGVVIYYKKHLSVTCLTHNLEQCTALFLKIELKKSTIHLLGIYRSPSTHNVEPFVNSLEKLIEQQNRLVIVGDININLQDKNCKEYQRYIDTLSTYGYISCINDMTRIQGEQKSCIDHIFIHESIYTDQIKALNVETKITDHFTQIINITHENENKCTQQTYNKILRSTIDYRLLNKALETEQWIEVTDETGDVDKAYELFFNKYEGHINKYTKTIHQKPKARDTRLKPWITNDLVNKIRYRDKILKNKNTTTSPYLNNFIVNYCNKLKYELRAAKNEYYKNQLLDCNKDIKKTWKTINCITNSNKSHSTTIKEINIDGTDIQVNGNEERVAEVFNQYYITASQKLEPKSSTPHQNTQTQHEKRNITPTIFLRPVNEPEIKNTIQKLKNTNSTGVDKIQIRTLKETCNHITKPITHIINLMLCTAKFPQQLKDSIVIPIYKNSDKKDIKNYRPISLLNNISKIFERVLHEQITDFIEKNKIISPRQYGFQKHKNCQDALYDLNNKINLAKNDKKYSLCIFLDLCKAFDTIPYNLLIKKLENVGLRGNCVQIIRSYLKNRTQKVSINGKLSNGLTIMCGVPQGTILAPLCFNLFVNNMLELNVNGEISAFADDTKIFNSATTRDELYKAANEDFLKIREWLTVNKLSINLKKTNYIEFNTCNKQTMRQQLEINEITNTKSTKYLGVIWDEDMKWEEHINNIATKLRKIKYKFLQLRTCVQKEIVMSVYYALVQSHLTFGITCYGGAKITTIDPLFKIQKQILKIIFKKPKSYPTSDLFNITNTLSIYQLFIKSSIIEIYKRKNLLNGPQHNHGTRYKLLEPIQQSFTKYSKLQQQTTHLGVNHYNKLPIATKNKKTLRQFKKHLVKTNWIKTNIPLTPSYHNNINITTQLINS